jgi:hypothetical protein
VAAVVLVLLAAGAALLGLFPPEPVTQRVEKPVPLDRVTTPPPRP